MRDAGFSLVELLVATAVMLTATGAVFAMLNDSIGRSHVWNEAADLQQRGRVATEALASEIGQAGAGTSLGRLADFLAAIEPRIGAAAISGAGVTIRQVPIQGGWSSLTTALPPGGGATTILRHSGCADPSCGFAPGTRAVVHDSNGNWTPVSVDAVAGETLTLGDQAARGITYGVGAQVIQFEETSLYFDAAQRMLRRAQPGAGDFPVVDNVVAVEFEYLGDTMLPRFPRPARGIANCLYDADGARLPTAALPAVEGGLALLPLDLFRDGPFCGSGGTTFDADLLRIRLVRTRIRLQSGVEALRGRDARLFAQPGTASASERALPDLVFQFDVSPASLQR